VSWRLCALAARGERLDKNEKIMKKAPARECSAAASDELSHEYRFDYSEAKPNRFASQVDPTRLVVALDADMSAVFTTPEAVNKALRKLIEAMLTPSPTSSDSR
jgi:hypothetical protein